MNTTTARRIPGTTYLARPLYRSPDGSVREYALTAEDGRTLGTVSYHGKRPARAAGYHEGTGAYDHRKPSWSNLAQAAKALAARAGVDL
jgi:hypothetical protein